MNDTIWSRNEHWVGTEIEDSFVMINVESGLYVALNGTASAIWHAIEAPSSDAAVVEHLRERFAVDHETCARSVSRTLAEMRSLDLVMSQ